MFNSEVNTQCASRFLSRALQRYESDCGALQLTLFLPPSPLSPPSSSAPSPSSLNIVNLIHTSTSYGCITCKPPLALSEIIALHDTFACSCTNAQSSGDSCAARRPQLCLIAQRKIGRIVRESIGSLVSHSRRTADLKCLNALSQSSPAELDLSVIAKSRIELPCGTLDEIVSLPFAARTLIKLLRYCVSIFDIDISIKRLKKRTADKTRSEPPGGIGSKGEKGDREMGGERGMCARVLDGRAGVGGIGRIIEWYVTVLCRFARNVGAVSELMAAGQMFRGFSAELSCPRAQHNAPTARRVVKIGRKTDAAAEATDGGNVVKPRPELPSLLV
ncbi:hypothetical protein ALC56_12714 [Trachymyrmex septentrionalis]|uniref:Uncharacterized protein n=1 Tax=Trachymyrmex septentrionalis TaxID=34720 RepID=A0A195EXE5_9HYME|nr:hypothetical protein ALC56_12714 [Trachymyrmex septentrionalis]